jgi:hypothetical protein
VREEAAERKRLRIASASILVFERGGTKRVLSKVRQVHREGKEGQM